MNPATFALVVTSVLFNAFAQLVLRKGMTAGPIPPVRDVIPFATTMVGNGWLWAGMGCYVISIGLWLAVLGRLEVSVAYPMLSIGYIVASILGVMLLGEHVGAARAAGIALICAGVFVIGRTA